MSVFNLCPLQEGDCFMYFLVHHNVIFYKRHFFPIGMEETLKNGRGFLRAAEVDALCGVHQFDGKDMFQVVHHFIEFGCGIGTHAYMVFLSVGRDDGIARSCIAVHFILADHGGGGILGNHESGVQTGVSYEKFR